MVKNNMSSQAQPLNEDIGHKPTVLIVDDSKVIRLALSKILKKDFEVVQAVDGEDAWDKIEENSSFLAIFSDVLMPNLDGFGLLERVRNSTDDYIVNLPFVIITANDDDADFHEKVIASGGSDLITKPFKTDQIIQCIQQHITVPDSQEVAEVEIELTNDEVIDLLNLDQVDLDMPTTIEAETIEPESVGTCEVAFSVDEAFLNHTNEAEPSIEFDLDQNLSIHEIPDDHKAEADLDNLPGVPEFIDHEEDISMQNSSAENINEITGLDFSFDDAFSVDPADSDTAIEIDDIPELSDIHDNTKPVSGEQITESGGSGLSDKKLAIEQARKRAMDIARNQAEYELQHSTSEIARRETETNEIRKQLEKLRNIESGTGVEKSKAENTSFFSRFMRIITLAFLFRK